MELTFLVQIRASVVVDAAVSASTVDCYCCDAMPSDGDAGDVGVGDGDDVLESQDDVDVAHESDGDVAMAATFPHLSNALIAWHQVQRLMVKLPRGQHLIPMLGPLSTLTALC